MTSKNIYNTSQNTNNFTGQVTIDGDIKADDAEFNNVHVLNNLNVDGVFNVGESTFDNILITNPNNLEKHTLQLGDGAQYHYDHVISSIFGVNYYNFNVSNDLEEKILFSVQPVTAVMDITNISTTNQLTLRNALDSWNLTNNRAFLDGMVLKSIGPSTVWSNMYDQELNTIDRPSFKALTITRPNAFDDALIAFSASGFIDWVIGAHKQSDPYDFDIRVAGVPIIGLNEVGNSYITPNLDLVVQARTSIVTAIAGQDAIFTIAAPIGQAPIFRWLVNDVIKFNMLVDLSNTLRINNFTDGGKGVISIDGATSLITLNDDVVVNGSIKLDAIIEPARPVDGKTIMYSKFDQDPYFNNSAGINYTTDNTGFRMVPPLTYCEASYFGNTLAVAFSGIVPEWVTVATNVNLVLGKTNIAKYTTYQVVGAQLSIFNPPRVIRYNLTCSFTCDSSSAGAAVPREFAIWVNGVEQRGKQSIRVDDANSTFPVSNTIICIIDVVANISNVILLRVRNPDNSTNNIIVHDLSFILTELQ